MNLLNRKVRGFRLIDLVAFGVLTLIILGVYLAKTLAGSERTQIAGVERQIGEEQARIRLLQAEVSHLEQPARIERLSETYLGLGPVAINRETSSDALGDIARGEIANVASPVTAENKARAAMALAVTPAASPSVASPSVASPPAAGPGR